MLPLLNPKLDLVFKLLFVQDAEILLDLVNRTLASPEPLHIRHLEVKNPTILPEELTEKYIILDILAEDEAQRHYDIEMQVQRYSAYPQRALYYLCRLYGTQLDSGQSYGRLMPVIGIHFLDYEHFPAYPDRQLCFELREGRHPELRLTRDLAMHLFELPKLERQGQPAFWGDPLWEWLHFLNHAHEEDEHMRTQYTNPMIHKAFDLLESLSADELTRQRAEVREKALKNEISLLEDARREGRAEGRAEGVDLGEVIGEIRALQRVLKIPVESKETLMTHAHQDLQNMLRQLEATLDARS
jgi:predicted transposase/invertase (TIGR01784 family)